MCYNNRWLIKNNIEFVDGCLGKLASIHNSIWLVSHGPYSIFLDGNNKTHLKNWAQKDYNEAHFLVIGWFHSSNEVGQKSECMSPKWHLCSKPRQDTNLLFEVTFIMHYIREHQGEFE